MTLDDAMRAACASVGIVPPPNVPMPGKWKRTNTMERNGKGDASVLIFDDQSGGICWNWQTSQKQPFRVDGPTGPVQPHRRDPEKERRKAAEQAEVERVCAAIVAGCKQDVHSYLEAKGFPTEIGLIQENPWRHFPTSELGESMAHAMIAGPGPFLIVPGRIGKRITTVQFIAHGGEKKNIFRGIMGGASHRIATGRQTVVCEGIATALTVRAALRLLGASATVMSAFSASNVAKVAASIPGAFIAADHDKPVDAFGGLGTGEYYALRSGCRWLMPPNRGDWNDHHAAHGLRDVALRLREVLPP